MTFVSEVHWLGVLAAALVHFMLGGGWYMGVVPKHYQVALGRNDPPGAKPSPLVIVGPAVCSVVIVATTAMLLKALAIMTYGGAVGLGALVGLGYLTPMVMVIAINPNLPRPFYYAAINAPSLNHTLPKGLRDIIDAPSVGTPPSCGVQNPESVDVARLRLWSRQGRKLRIRYVDESGATSGRTVWPLMVGYVVTTRRLVAWRMVLTLGTRHSGASTTGVTSIAVRVEFRPLVEPARTGRAGRLPGQTKQWPAGAVHATVNRTHVRAE